MEPRPKPSDYRDEGPSDYSQALDRWAKGRKDLLADAIEGLGFWDRLLITEAESFSEYQDLRSARLTDAVRWAVQRRIRPD